MVWPLELTTPSSLDNLDHTALEALEDPGDFVRIQFCHCTGNGLVQGFHRRIILDTGIMIDPPPKNRKRIGSGLGCL
uniref:Uncharacterized protein n=1 Tax=Lepeophtheirus salmonis TaxID=72036 RepID=A0A0K2SVG5_LEPSM